MYNQILKEIDKEVERLENMMTEKTEDALMDRIQGILWVRNLVYKDLISQPHDVEKYYTDEYTEG